MLLVLMLGVAAIVLLSTWLIVLQADTEAMSTRAEALGSELDRFEGA
jgi:hypothetical protein